MEGEGITREIVEGGGLRGNKWGGITGEVVEGGGGGVTREVVEGGGVWHKASVSDCLPLAAPIGLSPLLILTLCGPERVLVVSTEPPDDLSCLTTPGVGRPGDGAVARAVWGGGRGFGTQKFVYPPPPLQSPGVARDGLPGGGGRRSPSDGVPGGGGGALQGYLKANCGTLH